MSYFKDILAHAKNLAPGASKPTESRCVIVGLGNPGERYAATRHNAGFIALDVFAQEYNAADNWRARFDSLVSEKKAQFDGEDIMLALAKPQTMMNKSGSAVKGLLKHYGLKTDGLIVVHDDIDLPPGTLRVKFGGGHGGHNGIRDIIDAVGADFYRVKVGVGEAPGRMDSADYVLQRLKDKDLEELCIDAARGADAVKSLLENGLEKTQNLYN